jgi:hypothetical protein
MDKHGISAGKAGGIVPALFYVLDSNGYLKIISGEDRRKRRLVGVPGLIGQEQEAGFDV